MFSISVEIGLIEAGSVKDQQKVQKEILNNSGVLVYLTYCPKDALLNSNVFFNFNTCHKEQLNLSTTYDKAQMQKVNIKIHTRCYMQYKLF